MYVICFAARHYMGAKLSTSLGKIYILCTTHDWLHLPKKEEMIAQLLHNCRRQGHHTAIAGAGSSKASNIFVLLTPLEVIVDSVLTSNIMLVRGSSSQYGLSKLNPRNFRWQRPNTSYDFLALALLKPTILPYFLRQLRTSSGGFPSWQHCIGLSVILQARPTKLKGLISSDQNQQISSQTHLLHRKTSVDPKIHQKSKQ